MVVVDEFSRFPQVELLTSTSAKAVVPKLDAGSGRNFISREAIEKLNLKPTCHESGQFVTINGVQKVPAHI